MPVYSVEGKLGTGKTKFAVWMAQQALLSGRRVASNVDLKLEHLVPNKGGHYVRIPDKPCADDLVACGHGNPDSYDEDKNGVMILDELGTWLNSRSFQDKTRAPLLDWFIHARKYGWDVFLIVQDAGMIDKQAREALIEYQVKCFRGDKIKIPIIGGILSEIHKPLGYLPKFHMAVSRIGSGANSVVAERWMYKGLDLHAAYDTRQVFRSDYEHGPYSQWYTPPPKKPTPWALFRHRVKTIFSRPAPAPRPMLPIVARIREALERGHITEHEAVKLTRRALAFPIAQRNAI
jgi:hypothetical protein